MSAVAQLRRVRVRVEGTVQGVGFRPFVYRLATELGLAGFVLNDARGVLLEAEGPAEAVDELLRRLPAEAPPLALVERVAVESRAPLRRAGFEIRPSPHGADADTPVAPDAATCDACLAELFDPANRRYRYAFVNCTDCGPRFTIVRGVPYDRPLTTMAGFEMCERCRVEYEDPLDRRYHAQPNACPDCGPALLLLDASGAPCPGDALVRAAEALLAGRILAVKGIGGYHLACRADDEDAVARLRGRKHREDKPFALMAPSLGAARELVELDAAAEALLRSPQRPIVLAPRAAGAPVAASVAPRLHELGVMLPYSPLHHLLVADAGTALVLTSGNVSDEPIAYRDGEALERLGGIADLFLVHDRPIETRTDDSVARGGLVLRRSRGYVPASLPLAREAARPILACGAELKTTFCLAKGRRAWVSHHVGDLESYETYRSFCEGVEHFERLFAVTPELVAHDLHPEYLSTKYALERGLETVGVQHHHAHLAACLAEHGEHGPAAGAIFDGSGYGSDGTIWGGELLLGDLASFERAGMLLPVRLPGGERAIRQPWRMACAWLAELGVEEPLAGVDPDAWARVRELARSGLASPVTTSIGRLFDAVAALCGVRSEIAYEGQAAVELEACCDAAERGRYPFRIGERDGALVLDPRETLAAIRLDLARKVEVGVVAARFHSAVAHVTAEALARVGSESVVLGGGVFQNRRLLEQTSAQLAGAGLRVLVPERLPPGDGGISYGQANVAVARS